MAAQDISEVEVTQPKHAEQLETARAPPDVETNNFHGLDLKTVLVYVSVNLIAFAQILNLVGSGAYARNIAAAVGGSTETTWLSQVIAIVTCVLAPPVSQAADLWGRKWLIVILTLFGFVGSIVVSRCTSMAMAIGGEVISAISFGAQPLLYAVVSEILPRRFRPAAQAGVNVSVALAGIFGLLVGATLIDKYTEGFRIYYYITGAINAVSAIVCALFYTPVPRPLQKSLTRAQKFRRLDWVGYVLLSSGLVLFSIALTWSDNPYSWDNAHIIAPFVVGMLLLVCLGTYQIKFKNDGMFHHSLFKQDRNFAIAVVGILVEGMCFFAVNDFFPLELSVLFQTDAFGVGLRFSITFFTQIVACFGIAIYSSMTKTIRLPTTLAFCSIVVFFILLATVKTSISTALWVYPIFLGLGLGICLTCVVTAAQISAPPALIAITSGLLISTRSLGGSIALPIYTAIFKSKITTSLGPDIAARVLPLGISHGLLPQFIAGLTTGNETLLMSLPGVTPQMIQAGARGLQEAYLSSLRYVWVTAAMLAFIAASCSMFLIDPSQQLNMHVDAPLEGDPHDAH